MLKKRDSNQHGYTLIEMAIVIIILGVVIASAAQGYLVYERKNQLETTANRVKVVTNELQKFRQLRGYFPCPAPLSAPRDAPSYGSPIDRGIGAVPCNETSTTADATPAAGAVGVAGTARTTSLRAGLANPQIRIGAIPFRALQIEEKDTYDAYGSRIVYAVTASLTDPLTFNTRDGGITIIDADGNSDATSGDSALFAIFSPGRNRMGGYNREGNITSACNTAVADGENCNFDSQFRSAFESNAGGASQYDDVISIFSELQDKMWVRSEANSNNIHNLVTEDVGIGTRTPLAKLDIEDRSAAGRPEGTLNATGAIRTDRLCPPNTLGTGTNTNCFEPRNIAGNNSTNPANNTPGDGMRCPAGQYMTGIQDGRAICGAAMTGCANPAVDYMTGIDGSGNPICVTRPCNSQSIQLCPLPIPASTLPQANVNTTRTITAGANRTSTYQCRVNAAGNSVSWVRTSGPTGSCSCTPSSTTTGGLACGTGWTGSYSQTVTTVCPAGTSTTTNTRAADCRCAARPNERNDQTCSSYLNNPNVLGNILRHRVWQCPAGRWGNWIETNDCRCDTPAVTTRAVQYPDSCPAGQNPTAPQMEVFNAATCSWVRSPVSCACNQTETRTVEEDPACGADEYVFQRATYTQIRDGANCSWGTRTLVTDGVCRKTPYFWRSQMATGTYSTSGISPEVDGECLYPQVGQTRNCSRYVSTNQYEIHRCLCGR